MASIANAYTVNGVLVSDFVTPEYYGHPMPVPGTAYSFTGAIMRPRDVADDGYVTWREPLGEWWQAGRSGGRLRFSRLGRLDSARLALRRLVDSRYTPRELIVGVPESHPQLRAARERHASESGASAARAAAWSLVIKRVAAARPVPTRTAAPPDPGEVTLRPRIN